MDNNIEDIFITPMMNEINNVIGGDCYIYSGDCIEDDDIDSSMFSEIPEETVHNLASSFIQSITQSFEKKENEETLKERLSINVGEHFSECYDCTRVWSAWGYGTMTHSDFVPVPTDTDRINDFVESGLMVKNQIIAYLEKNSLLNTLSSGININNTFKNRI